MKFLEVQAKAPEYDPLYWDSYYEGPYESTYQQGFSAPWLLSGWFRVFPDLPLSFADIGSGPGQTLKEMRKSLGSEALIYGVESQQIPPERCLSGEKLVFGDFLDLYPSLPQVDLLYVSCSMYVPWSQQEEFLGACLKLGKRAFFFANLYLEDGEGIPEDRLRQVIYRTRYGFKNLMERQGLIKPLSDRDFFVRPGGTCK